MRLGSEHDANSFPHKYIVQTSDQWVSSVINLFQNTTKVLVEIKPEGKAMSFITMSMPSQIILSRIKWINSLPMGSFPLVPLERVTFTSMFLPNWFISCSLQ